MVVWLFSLVVGVGATGCGLGVALFEGEGVEVSAGEVVFLGDLFGGVFESGAVVDEGEDFVEDVFGLFLGWGGALDAEGDFAEDFGVVGPVVKFGEGAALGFFVGFGEFSADGGWSVGSECLGHDMEGVCESSW